MYQRVLLAVDGSSTSNAALEEGIRFARDQGARLRLVHVLDLAPLSWGTEEYFDISVIQDAIRRAGEQILDQAAKRAENVEMAVETALLESYGERIPNMIIEAARNWPADLIVIGTHGRRGFDHLLMGSVAEGVLRTAPVPVLLIRAA
jgi:nucleotide-binding universal stress UspA family protein